MMMGVWGFRKWGLFFFSKSALWMIIPSRLRVNFLAFAIVSAFHAEFSTPYIFTSCYSAESTPSDLSLIFIMQVIKQLVFFLTQVKLSSLELLDGEGFAHVL
jgi:hypothetical protein